MDGQFEKIKEKFETYSNLNVSERQVIQNDLLVFARKNREFFILKIREIEPNEKYVLFEFYETLSQEAEFWVDFIISEFNRIKHLTETAKKKEQKSISYPLTALSFFTQQNFNGIEKLKTTIKSGLHSKSENIVLICLDLLADFYHLNKIKHLDCKLEIERYQNSKSKQIAQLAKELIKEIDSTPKKNSTLKKIVSLFIPSYTNVIFFLGILLSIKTIGLFDDTFVAFSSVVFVFTIVAVLSGLIHYFRKQNKKDVLGIIIGYGLISVFLWLFLNFNFPQSELKSEVFKIKGKGMLAKGRYSKCRTPYIVFSRKDMNKKLDYNCSEQELVDKSNFIKIETANGLFGLEIIKQKELMENEK